MAPAVYRWRIREIVTSSFRPPFLGFGVIAVHGFTEDVATTARIISGLAAVGGIVSIVTSMRPGPAWPDETDRKWAVGPVCGYRRVMTEGPATARRKASLFTDIESSTRLREEHSEEMALAFERHDAIMRGRYLAAAR